MSGQKLYQQGWERFPWWWILGENLLLLIPLGIGLVVMWPLQVAGVPLASLGYGLFFLIMVGWLLKVHNCSTCYYYDKWCHTGWGKYTVLICKRGMGNPEIGAKLIFTYIVLPVVPIVGAVLIALSGGFSWGLLAAMAVFLALTVIQFALRPKGCSHCKRRFACPGSAATDHDIKN